MWSHPDWKKVADTEIVDFWFMVTNPDPICYICLTNNKGKWMLHDFRDGINALDTFELHCGMSVDFLKRRAEKITREQAEFALQLSGCEVVEMFDTLFGGRT